MKTRSAVALVLALTFSPSLAAAAQLVALTVPAPPKSSQIYSLDTPIKDLVADPSAKAVLDNKLPGLTTHAQYDAFRSMSLKELKPLAGGLITDERLKATDAALKALAAE